MLNLEVSLYSIFYYHGAAMGRGRVSGLRGAHLMTCYTRMRSSRRGPAMGDCPSSHRSLGYGPAPTFSDALAVAHFGDA